MNEQLGFGGLPSPLDYRDEVVAKAVIGELGAVPLLPEEFKTDIAQLEVLMQAKVPACVSHAWVIVMKYYWWKKTGKIINFSPRFLDILSSETWIPYDGGRVPRTVCRISKNFGCCTTDLLPNETAARRGETVEQTIRRYRGATITPAMYEEAAKYKIPGYVRINDNGVVDFRTGIYQFGLVSGLFSIGSEFWSPSYNPKDIMPLKTPQTSVGGHQMVVYGWTGVLNWLRNSWGKLWGYTGDGTYDASKWLPHVYEGWAIASVPKDVSDFLKNLPKPEEFSYTWNTDMRLGDYNDDVKFLQIALMILGFLGPINPEDLGHYGPKTSIAVGKYQTAKRISPTAPNSAGPKTRGFLNTDFAA